MAPGENKEKKLCPPGALARLKQYIGKAEK